MNKIIAFAGSNSKHSINHQLLEIIQRHFSNEFELVKLSDYDIPMFGVDLEAEIGTPKAIEDLYTKINSTSILLMGCSEHNGNMTSFMKSTLDWLSRRDRSVFEAKDIFLCGTSTGRKGASESIAAVKRLVERLDGDVTATFSLPSFNHVFEDGELIPEHRENLDNFVHELKASIHGDL